MKKLLLLLPLLLLAALLPAQNSPLTLTAPNGGEVWATGSTQNITWTQQNLAGNVSLMLIPGQHMIAEAVPVADGIYSWTIPTTILPGTFYRVRIYTDYNPGTYFYDLSDAVFAITGDTPPPPPPPPVQAITLTAPNGGESWAIGSTQAITWTHVNLTGNVGLMLIPGQHLIAENVPVTDLAYDWTIPNTVYPGTMYRVRVFQTSADGTYVCDFSDAVFAITGDTPPPPPVPVLTLTAPNGGESWAIGSTQAITWTSENLTGTASILLMGAYNHNPGANLIAEDVPVADGTFAWTIPNTILPGNNYRVKIVVANPNSCFATDISDAVFAITGDTTPPPLPNLVLTSPNGGESWQAGTTHPITWTFDGTEGMVMLQLLGGPNMAPVQMIAQHVPAAAGTFDWNIPPYLMPLDACQVRIALLANTGVLIEDSSDAPFSITAGTPDPSGIVVTAPNGGEAWEIGSTQTITWTDAEYTGEVKIFLIRGGTSHHARRLIASQVPNTGTYSWTIPANIVPGDAFRIQVRKVGGGFDLSDAAFSIVAAPMAVKASPNPTSQGSRISFEVKSPVSASVRIYNLKGQCVRTLVDGQTLSGKQDINWDGNDQNGRKVSAGVYFARISSPEFNASRKIIVLK